VPEALPTKARDYYVRVKEFIEQEILPIEEDLLKHAQGKDQWTPNPMIETLKVGRLLPIDTKLQCIF
jgi:hypothetical protein